MEELPRRMDSIDWNEGEIDVADIDLTPQLLEAWRVRMRRWCARELGGEFASRVDTSDVVQESMIQIWQDWERFRGGSIGEVKAWMYRIAKGHLNKARRHHRAAKRNVRTEVAVSNEPNHPRQSEPGEQASTAEDRLQLMIALEQLPDELKDVIQRRIFGLQSFPEISQALDCSLAEARNRYLRAVRRLRSLLQMESSVAQES